jgi:hypothetical protein
MRPVALACAGRFARTYSVAKLANRLQTTARLNLGTLARPTPIISKGLNSAGEVHLTIAFELLQRAFRNRGEK